MCTDTFRSHCIFFLSAAFSLNEILEIISLDPGAFLIFLLAFLTPFDAILSFSRSVCSNPIDSVVFDALGAFDFPFVPFHLSPRRRRHFPLPAILSFIRRLFFLSFNPTRNRPLFSFNLVHDKSPLLISVGPFSC